MRSTAAKRGTRDAVLAEASRDPGITGDCSTCPTIYELNRMVDAWDARCKTLERKRGYGLPNRLRARGGTWLASMATLLSTSVKTVRVHGIPCPAVKYRGVWFVNFSRKERS